MSLWLFRIFLIWYGCGFVLLSLDLIPPPLEWANVVFLVLAGILGGIYFVKLYGSFLGLSYSLFVGIFSIVVEHLGVQYQLWFGHYTYEQDFGPMVGGVPITIGFAWLMVIAGSHEISRMITSNRALFLLIGAALAVTIDLILDPVAFIVKEYWIWESGSFFYGIPFSNFVGWFFLSAFFHGIGCFFFTQHSHIWGPRMVIVFGGVQFMFLWLGLLGGIYWAAFLNGCLLSLWILGYFKNSNYKYNVRRFL